MVGGPNHQVWDDDEDYAEVDDDDYTAEEWQAWNAQQLPQLPQAEMPPPPQQLYQQAAFPLPPPCPPTILKDPFVGHKIDATYVLPTDTAEVRFSVQGFDWLRIHGTTKVKKAEEVQTIKGPTMKIGGLDYRIEFVPNRDCLDGHYNSDMFAMISICDPDVGFGSMTSNSSSAATSSSVPPKKVDKIHRVGTCKIACKVIQENQNSHLVDCGVHKLRFDDGRASLGFALMSPALFSATELLFYISLRVVTNGGVWISSPPASNEQKGSSLSADFSNLLQSGRGSDCKIKTGNGVIRNVHSLILNTRSPVFRVMLESNFSEGKQKRNGEIAEINMKEDVDEIILDRFLEFIYTGNVDISQKDSRGNVSIPDWTINECFALADLSHKYDIPSLLQFVSEKLHLLFHVDNIARIISWADRHNCENLKSSACKFATRDAVVLAQVQKTEAFKKLDADCLQALLSATVSASLAPNTPPSRPFAQDKINSNNNALGERGVKRSLTA